MKKDVLPKTHFEKYVPHLKYLTCDDILDKLSEAEVYDDILHDLELYKIFLENLKKNIIAPEGFPQSFTSNVLSQMFLTNRYKKFYNFEKDITELLTQTSLRKMDVDLIKSPYPCIYLSIPHNTTFTIEDENTGTHIVEAIYVYYKEIDPNLVKLHPDIPQNTKIILRCLVVGKGKPSESYLGDYDDALNFITIFLGKGDIFEQIDEDIERKLKEGNIPKYFDIEGMRQIHSFVVNALLYITSAQARLDFCGTRLPNPYQGNNPKKQKRAKKENKKASTVNTFCKVGEKIISPPSGFDGIGISKPVGNKPMFQFKVHPHWQHYWTGKGRTKRIHKFKIEYIKGKQFAEALEKSTITVTGWQPN